MLMCNNEVYGHTMSSILYHRKTTRLCGFVVLLTAYQFWISNLDSQRKPPPKWPGNWTFWHGHWQIHWNYRKLYIQFSREKLSPNMLMRVKKHHMSFNTTSTFPLFLKKYIQTLVFVKDYCSRLWWPIQRGKNETVRVGSLWLFWRTRCRLWFNRFRFRKLTLLLIIWAAHWSGSSCFF